MDMKAGHGLLVVALVLLCAACGGSNRTVGPLRPIGFEGDLQRILDQAVISTDGA
jgi:hypothetical protein